MLYKEFGSEKRAVPHKGADSGNLRQVLCREQCVTQCLDRIYGVAWYAVIGVAMEQSFEDAVGLKAPLLPLIALLCDIIQREMVRYVRKKELCSLVLETVGIKVSVIKQYFLISIQIFYTRYS